MAAGGCGHAGRRAAAAIFRDARRMRVGWAIVWKRTPLVYGYLRQVGFRYGYRADGVNVYRLGRPPR
jgi:hypothetical protein